jgi:hypothetical protein
MVRISDEMYAVVLQSPRNQRRETPESCERTVAVCASYEEARRVKQYLHQGPDQCIIRCVGETGGSD